MFFMMGIMDGHKDLEFDQVITCSLCGSYGSFKVFMTYTVLSLFFIPCFKWNRHYYVRTSCCGSIYELDAEIGKRIAKGENVEILPEHLSLMQNNGAATGNARKCHNCGYEMADDFDFCPKCGMRY